MQIITKLIILIIICLSAASVAARIHDARALDADPAKAKGQIAPKLEGLGNYHLPVTTQNPESQAFFDQGLRLTYAFNHSEALRSFKEAVRLDPNNAMAYWGWALVLGPNLNLPMIPDVAPQAFRAMQKAVSLKDKVSDHDRAYIEALTQRYSDQPTADRKPFGLAYAQAMRKVVKTYPDDLDAVTLYAADLIKNPENGYSLFGLKMALEQQGKSEDALAVSKRIEHAWAGASHRLTSSRY